VITVVPELTPVAIPEAVPIVALATELLDHVPPVDVFVRVVVAPGQTVSIPPIAGGGANTVTVVVTLQPAVVWYMMSAVPAVMPVTLPLLALTDTVGSELLHTPPDGVVVRLINDPGHTGATPVIGAGVGLTNIGQLATATPHPLVTV
jgi:hypothetical protein